MYVVRIFIKSSRCLNIFQLSDITAIVYYLTGVACLCLAALLLTTRIYQLRCEYMS